MSSSKFLRVLLAVGLLAPLAASAKAWCHMGRRVEITRGEDGQGEDRDEGKGKGGGARSVPEFDPAAAGVAAALLAGGGLLIARKRRTS